VTGSFIQHLLVKSDPLSTLVTYLFVHAPFPTKTFVPGEKVKYKLPCLTLEKIYIWVFCHILAKNKYTFCNLSVYAQK